MKQQLRVLLAIIMLGLLWQGNIQAQVKYPVTISNLVVTPSVFLSDYTSIGSGAGIKASLKFTDYNEPPVERHLQCRLGIKAICNCVNCSLKY